jgi:hypothetical protein
LLVGGGVEGLLGEQPIAGDGLCAKRGNAKVGRPRGVWR